MAYEWLRFVSVILIPSNMLIRISLLINEYGFRENEECNVLNLSWP